MKPILVDLCCGAGGATKGYQRAGFYVIGVDIAPQPNYCGDHFIRMDALKFLSVIVHGGTVGWIDPGIIAAYHASFPCQDHSALTKGNRERGWIDDHTDLIAEGRELLDRTGNPYVLENVQGSPLRRDLVLCGLKHFGLRVFKHRYFELGGWSMPEMYCDNKSDHAGHRVSGWRHGVKYEGDMVAVYGDGGGKGSITDWEEAMGIDWVTVGEAKDRKKSLAEAIPPLYSLTVGTALMAHLQGEVAA